MGSIFLRGGNEFLASFLFLIITLFEDDADCILPLLQIWRRCRLNSTITTFP